MATCPNGHDSAAADYCDVCGHRIARPPASEPIRTVGKHHAPRPGTAPDPAETCPRCGTVSVGQFCEACGFRFRARRPFGPPDQSEPSSPGIDPFDERSWPAPGSAPPGSAPPGSAPPGSAPPGSAPFPPTARPRSSGPPESLFPPVAKPEPLPSPWGAPQPPSAPPAPSPPPAAATWIAVVTSDRTYYDRMQVERAVTGPAVPFPVYNDERRFPLAGNQMRIGRRSAARGLEPEIDLAGPPADPGVSRLHAVLIASPDGTWGVLDPGSANGTLLNGSPISIGNLIPLRDGDRINLGAWTAITVHRG